MKSKKYDRKTNKRTIKKIQKLIASSSLNPFILHYYESLKPEELNTNREAVIDKINYNNKGNYYVNICLWKVWQW